MIFTLEIISALLALYSTLMILIPQTRDLIMMNMNSCVGGTIAGPPSPPSTELIKRRKRNRRFSLSIIFSGMLAVLIQAALPILERFSIR